MMANTSVLALSVPMAPVTHWLGRRRLGGAAAHPGPGRYGVGLVLGAVAAPGEQPGGGLDRRPVVRFRAGHGVARQRAHELRHASSGAVHRLAGAAAAGARPGRGAAGSCSGCWWCCRSSSTRRCCCSPRSRWVCSCIAYAALARRQACVDGAAVPGRAGSRRWSPRWCCWPIRCGCSSPGRGSYHGQPFEPDKYVTDLLSLGAFARQSLAGNAAMARRLSVSPTEDNTFFGRVGLVMIIVSVGRAVALAGRPGRRDRRPGAAGHVAGPAAAGRRPRHRHPAAVRADQPPAGDRPGERDPVRHGGRRRSPGCCSRWPPTGCRAGRAGAGAFWIGLVLALVPLLPKPLPVVGRRPAAAVPGPAASGGST